MILKGGFGISGKNERIKAYFVEQWDRVADRLIKAITEDDLEDVETLLAQGVPLDVRVEGDTALTRAVLLGRLKMVKLLMKYNADINIPDDRGRTPLILAAHHGYEKILRILLRGNVDLDAATPRGRTALIEAAEGGHIDCVRLLIQRGADVNRGESGWLLNGETALMKAAYEGFSQIVRQLVKAKADLDRHAVFNGLTAVGLAAKKGRLEILQLLIANKANPDAEDDQGKTPLMEASENGWIDLVKYLLRKKVRINAEEKLFLRTPLIMAVRNHHQEVVAILLAKRADTGIADIDGNTALHWAVKMGSEELTAILVKKKADPTRKNGKGLNVFQLAEKLSDLERREKIKTLLTRCLPKKIPAIKGV